MVLHVEHSTPDEVMETALQLQSALARELEGPVIVALSGTGRESRRSESFTGKARRCATISEAKAEAACFVAKNREEPSGSGDFLRMDGRIAFHDYGGEHASIESCLARILRPCPIISST